MLAYGHVGDTQVVSAAVTPSPSSTSAITMSLPANSASTVNKGGSGSTTTLVWVAIIALLGVLITAGIQWWVGKRSTDTATKNLEFAKEQAAAARGNAEAAKSSAESAAKSAQAAQDAVAVNADSAASVAKRAEADALAKRYQEAATLLGDDKAPVRLAGVYAMARLADDWEEQRQTCVAVLCAYLRMPWEPQAGEDHRSDGQVRSTIIQIVNHHLQPQAIPSWSQLDFDFSGAVFRNALFAGAVFETVPNFQGCEWQGVCHFLKTTFRADALLTSALVTGELHIEDVVLEGTILYLSNMTVCGESALIEVQMSRGPLGGIVQMESFRVTGGKVRLFASDGLRVSAHHWQVDGGSILIIDHQLNRDYSAGEIGARHWRVNEGTLWIDQNIVDYRLADEGPKALIARRNLNGTWDRPLPSA